MRGKENTAAGPSNNGSSAGESNSTSSASPISVFILMGKTGVGKSSFIKLLGGKDLSHRSPTIDSGVHSCTKKSAAYMTTIDGKKILLLDTPGFDDSAISTTHIVNGLVSQFYSIALKKPELETRGVIFLHDISETRFAGSQKKTLKILKALVGDQNMGNVIVGTTKWSPVGSAKFSQEKIREKTLREEEWYGVYKTTQVLEGEKDTAVQMIDDLFTRPPVTLLCQEEMMQPPHTMRNTTVGRMILPETHQEQEQLRREVKEQRRKLADIEKAFEEEARKQEARKQEVWKPDAVQWMHGAQSWKVPGFEKYKKEKERAEKQAEKLEEELKDSEKATDDSEKPYEPGWFEWLINLIIKWFSKFAGWASFSRFF